jgi:hypothetical protein
MAVTDEVRYYTGGIIHDKTGRMSNDHEISIIGWGIENGYYY